MSFTIQEIIDVIRSAVGVEAPEDTVDTFKIGDPSKEVTGIVTTFMATYAVILQAAKLRANLIITHEPTFYDHRDQTDWLGDDPVYLAKRRLLEETEITIWRFHDTWHMTQPDGILTGMAQDLGWAAYSNPHDPYLFNLPPTTVKGLANTLKEKLGLSAMRLVGDPNMPCQNVAFLMGSGPGEWQVGSLGMAGVDTLVTGETVEWQVCEYVRDANAAGLHKAMLAIGHEKSEEAGMRYLVDWLTPKIPGISITHIPAGDPIRLI